MEKQIEKLLKMLANADVNLNIGVITPCDNYIVNNLINKIPEDTSVIMISEKNEIKETELLNKRDLRILNCNKYDFEELIARRFNPKKQIIIATSDYVRENSLNLRNTMACGDKVVFCSRVNSPEDLINRFTAKCAMDEIESTYEYLENLSAKLINVIISYGIDKTDNILKVLDITEVILSDNKVLYNPLFKLNFKEEKNEVKSFYERIGNVSKKIERSLLLAGYSHEDFSEFI